MAVLRIRALLCAVVAAPLSMAASQEPAAACLALGTQESRSTRPSPLDSVSFSIGGKTAKLCYSRPSVRGRMVFDSLVPYGKAWRTGANEPTTLHLPVAAEVAGTRLAAGRYMIMTVPTGGDWTIVFNTTDAKDPASMLDSLVQVALGKARSERLDTHVEKLTFRVAPADARAPSELILEWEKTRVRIPIKPS